MLKLDAEYSVKYSTKWNKKTNYWIWFYLTIQGLNLWVIGQNIIWAFNHTQLLAVPHGVCVTQMLNVGNDDFKMARIWLFQQSNLAETILL